MIHIFDVDYTVIRNSTTWYFLREALRRKLIGFSQIRGLPFEWLRYKLGMANIDFIENSVKRLAGIDKTLLEETAEACFEGRMKQNIYREALTLVGEIKKNSEPVLFATSSFHTLIQPLERFFGITDSVASSLEFSGGKTSGRLAGGGFFGAKKKTAVEAWLKERSLKPEEVCFYSDSYTDLPLLEFTGRAVAVNPDCFLAQLAKKRGWQILRFKNVLGN